MEQTDKQTGDQENKYLRDVVPVLKKGLAIIQRNPAPITSPESKKRGLMAATNVLFKIYFTLDMFSAVDQTLRAIQQSSGDCMTMYPYFPVCDVATFKYYSGRISMFQDKLEEARESLRFALKCCPPDNIRNQQRVLASLIPIEMTLGVFPTAVVGEQYGLMEYVQLGDAARIGDIRTYSELLQQHQRTFIRVGVYLVLEQVKSLVYRNLYKRVVAIIGSTLIPLDAIERVSK